MTFQCLKNFNLSFYFTFFDRFKHFDDNIIVVGDGDARVYFRVLAFADLGYDLELFDVALSW